MPDSALRLNANYRVFTIDHDEDLAAARFIELYGQPPEQIIEEDGLLWVGPVPEREAGSSDDLIIKLAGRSFGKSSV